MLRHVKGTEVFINESNPVKANIGRKVRLLDWLAPHSMLNYHDELTFHGGSKGAWIVTPVDRGVLIGRGYANTPMITNLALVDDDNLGMNFTPQGPRYTMEEIRDIRNLVDNGPTFILNPVEFAAFEDLLKANPLHKNFPLKALLTKEPRWS